MVAVPGNTYVRFLRVMAKGRGNPLTAVEIARKDYGNESPVVGLLQKSIVTTGDLNSDAAWRAAADTFLDGVRAVELMSRIDAVSRLHKVPVRTRVLSEDTEPVAVWTEEGAIKEASAAAFTELTLTPQKCSGLIVSTNELIHLTNGYAENALKVSIGRSVSRLTSSAVFALASAAGAPPSLLENATEVPSGGDPQTDLTALLDAFQGDTERAVLCMSSSNAAYLALNGADKMTVTGGTFAGLPCVASSDIPDSVIALIDPAQIAFGDDGVRLDIATMANVEIDGKTVNLWSSNLTAFLAERYLTWQPASGAVAYLSDVDWRGNGGSTT